MKILARKVSSAAIALGRQLAKRRGQPFAEYLELCVGNFYRAFNNQNFDMQKNGELRVLQLLQVLNPKCIFDVGANVGEWSLLAAELFPSAKIHAFEIVPETFGQLKANTAHLPDLIGNDFGLSDKPGKIKIYMSDGSTDATACKIDGMALHEKIYTKEVIGETRRGIDYLDDHGIVQIDFLKIDVEGMELRVIKGFGEKIRHARVVQFEYGVFNISSRDLLVDFFNYLTSHGFVIGKVYPRWVSFFEYGFSQETLMWSNFVAVRSDESELIQTLRHLSI